MTNVLNILQLLHYIVKALITIGKDDQNMHHLFSYDYNWERIEFPAGIKI